MRPVTPEIRVCGFRAGVEMYGGGGGEDRAVGRYFSGSMVGMAVVVVVVPATVVEFVVVVELRCEASTACTAAPQPYCPRTMVIRDVGGKDLGR